MRNDVEAEEWQERTLSDGSRYEVYKRFFTGRGLAEEIGGGEILFEGRWFRGGAVDAGVALLGSSSEAQ